MNKSRRGRSHVKCKRANRSSYQFTSEPLVEAFRFVYTWVEAQFEIANMTTFY